MQNAMEKSRVSVKATNMEPANFSSVALYDFMEMSGSSLSFQGLHNTFQFVIAFHLPSHRLEPN